MFGLVTPQTEYEWEKSGTPAQKGKELKSEIVSLRDQIRTFGYFCISANNNHLLPIVIENDIVNLESSATINIFQARIT